MHHHKLLVHSMLDRNQLRRRYRMHCHKLLVHSMLGHNQFRRRYRMRRHKLLLEHSSWLVHSSYRSKVA